MSVRVILAPVLLLSVIQGQLLRKTGLVEDDRQRSKTLRSKRLTLHSPTEKRWHARRRIISLSSGPTDAQRRRCVADYGTSLVSTDSFPSFRQPGRTAGFLD